MAAAASAQHRSDPLATRIIGWGWLALSVALAGWFATMVPTIADGGAYATSVPWIPGLGINLSFRVDGLSLLFALLISGIGAIIFLYSGSYLAGHRQLFRFYLFLGGFKLSMLGLVLTDNLITLFVFWELTTVTSYLLIGFDHANPAARRSALQGLLVTGAGALALLAGVVLIGHVAGTYEISEILADSDVLRDSPLYLAILVLVLAGAFTKSAQWPFHFWLPNAMAAPTPISAYLHSATMVKAGVYLLARLQPSLDDTTVWVLTLTVFGAITAVLGSVLALRQSDLKLMLAYTTVMALGTCVLFLGVDSPIASTAAITFILVHALYKASLFLVVGAIDHGTGTRQIDRLGNLGKAMPITAATAAIAGLSMAGMPPFIGFIGKELKYKGTLAFDLAPGVLTAVVVTANACMVAVAVMIAWRVFHRPRRRDSEGAPHAPHEAPPKMWLGPIVLALLGLLFGAVPWLIDRGLVAPGVAALGEPESFQLALWHGINVPLALSVITLASGIVLYRYRDRIRALLYALAVRLPWSGDRAYDVAMSALVWIAKAQTRVLQGGVLRHYLTTVFVVLVVALGATLMARDALIWPAAWPVLMAHEWGVAALIVVGTVMAAFAGSRLAAICALGVVGVGVALLFLSFGAPDLAKTQLLVETLVVIIVAIVMLRLPRLAPNRSEPLWRPGHAVISVVAGGLLTLVLLSVTAEPFDLRITEYFEATSAPEAFGRNIVNVILVDFRALDTMGEIAVVAIAGLAAFGLIGLRRARRSEGKSR